VKSQDDLLTCMGLVRISAKITVHRVRHFEAILTCLLALIGPSVWAQGVSAQPGGNPAHVDLAAIVAHNYGEAKEHYLSGRTNTEVVWQFARACYDLADYATNRAERAELAREGIEVSQEAIAQNSNSAPAHYYLGMNQAQLARTKGLGALKIVRQMEQVFLRVRDLDEHLDYAGADRNLGLLYRDCPSFGSIGNRSKARQYLQRAVEVAPDYPENRLNLLETYFRWEERDSARQQLKALENIWNNAHSRLNGNAWASSWQDWKTRLDKVREKLKDSL
jgi:tetratricopeptide (TPR) repeat protein